MLRSLKQLESYKLSAIDGVIGKVTDFLFDDQHWTTRYLVTDPSGFWDLAYPVLISPISFRNIDWTAQLFHLALTKEKVQNSPRLDLDRPVSRQHERAYSSYYGWPYYWGPGMTGVWGMGMYPFPPSVSPPKAQPVEDKDDDPHLRSAKQVTGYHVHASDGAIGHIADFIMDDETWTIRYLVIDTSNWWIGNKVLVAPHWVHKVSWFENMVYLDMTKEAIKSSPPWSPEALLNREYEQRLYDHYGRPAYWNPANPTEKVGVSPP